MAFNVRSCFLTSQLSLRPMIAMGIGVLLNIVTVTDDHKCLISNIYHGCLHCYCTVPSFTAWCSLTLQEQQFLES